MDEKEAIPTLKMVNIRVTPIRQNCTIFFDDKNAIIIDPGGDIRKILLAIGTMDVHALLLTHGHFDHAGSAKVLQNILSQKQGKKVPIIGPLKEDEFLLDTVTKQAASFDLIKDIEDFKSDQYLKDGEVLEFAGHKLKALHIPGHTPGHVVYWDERGQRLITGDTLFRGTIGRSDFDYGDGDLLVKMIKEKIFTLPESTIVIPGHGISTTIGEEKNHNPYF